MYLKLLCLYYYFSDWKVRISHKIEWRQVKPRDFKSVQHAHVYVLLKRGYNDFSLRTFWPQTFLLDAWAPPFKMQKGIHEMTLLTAIKRLV